jgi:hypothetical protein
VTADDSERWSAGQAIEYLAQPLPPTNAATVEAVRRLVVALRRESVRAWGRIGDAVWREPIPADRWREPLTIRYDTMAPDDSADMKTYVRLRERRADLFRDIEVLRAEVEAMGAAHSLAMVESPRGEWWPDPKRYRYLKDWCEHLPARTEAKRRLSERADPPTETDICEKMAELWNAAARKPTTGASVAATLRKLKPID